MRSHVCPSCGGEYDNVLLDGQLYFHACAPVVGATTPDGATSPDARDENIVLDKDGKNAGMKAEGRGRLPAAGPPPFVATAEPGPDEPAAGGEPAPGAPGPPGPT